jgi:transcriptional regulator
MGPHAYMTPRVYPDLARVPTWNYLMVHCTVEASIIEHFDDKDRLLKHLIADHDPAYADQWRGLGEDYQHKMLKGIVAFELRVLTMQCKVKLNQHRPEAQAAMHALYAQGNDNERALAQWMDTLNKPVKAGD